MGLAVFVAEDLHGVVLLGDSGLNKIDRELGFGQGLDNSEVLVDFLVASINNVVFGRGLF